MKKYFLILIMSAFAISHMSWLRAADLVVFEEAIESSALSIRLSNDLKGIIKGKRCDSCDVLLIKINSSTRFDVNGVMKPLIEAQKWAGKPGTVIYDVKTLNATAISVYN